MASAGTIGFFVVLVWFEVSIENAHREKLGKSRLVLGTRLGCVVIGWFMVRPSHPSTDVLLLLAFYLSPRAELRGCQETTRFLRKNERKNEVLSISRPKTCQLFSEILLIKAPWYQP